MKTIDKIENKVLIKLFNCYKIEKNRFDISIDDYRSFFDLFYRINLSDKDFFNSHLSIYSDQEIKWLKEKYYVKANYENKIKN